MDPAQLQSLLLYVGVPVAVGIIVVVVALLLARRGPREPADGFSSFERARRVRADAYLLAIDVDANTIKWIPLKDMGAYYMFLTSKTGRFLPIDRRPLSVAGRPVFVGIKTGATSVEVSLPLALFSNVARLRDRDLFQRSPSFLSTIRKLYEKVLEEPATAETADSSVAIDVDYTGLFMQYAVSLAKGFERMMDALRSYAISTFERGEDIERRGGRGESWGKLILYFGFFLFIAVLAVIVYNMFR